MERKIVNEGGKKQNVFIGICESIMSFCIFLIFFSLPLFFLNLTFQGIIFEKQLLFYFLVFLGIVAWAVKGVVLGELKIKRTPLDIPIVLFWFTYLLATIFSVDRWHSFFGFFGDPSRGLLSVTSIILLYYLIFSNFNFRRAAMILTGLIFSGLIFSIWTLLAILGVKFLPASLLSMSPIILSGAVSSAGIIISVMIVIFTTFIFLIQGSEDMSKRVRNILTVFSLIGLALNLFLLIALYNFIPWEGLLIGLGIFLIFIISRIVRPHENWVWLPMISFVIIMGILMIGSVNISRINLPIEISPSFKTSAEVAEGVLKDKFFLGSGPGTYGYDFSLYRPAEFNNNYFYNLRFYQGTGVIAEGIATIGVLGMITALFLLVTYLSISFYYLSREKQKNKIFSLGLLSSSVIIIFCALVSPISGTILIWGAALASLSLAVLLFESEANDKSFILSLKTSPRYALALAFVFMVISISVVYIFVFLGKTFIADLYAGSAVRQEQPTEEGSIINLVKAVKLYPKEGRYYTRIGQEYMLLASSEMAKSEENRDLNKVKNYISNAIASGAQGKNLMKNDVLVVESLGQIYGNAGAYMEDSLNLSQEVYKEAQKLEPHNPNYLLELGNIKMIQASISEDENEKKKLIGEAKNLFSQSINEKKDFNSGYYQLALAQEVLGEIDESIKNMGQAFRLNNNNINYAFNLARLYQQRGRDQDNKIAEDLFKQIIGVNDKEINTHLSLGLLYEKTNRNGEAITEYKKVLEILSELSAQNKTINTTDSRDRVQKMINNVQNGVSNLSPNSSENNSQVTEPPAQLEQTEEIPSANSVERPEITPEQV